MASDLETMQLRRLVGAAVRRMLCRPGFTESEIADLSGATPEEVRAIAASMGISPA